MYSGQNRGAVGTLQLQPPDSFLHQKQLCRKGAICIGTAIQGEFNSLFSFPSLIKNPFPLPQILCLFFLFNTKSHFVYGGRERNGLHQESVQQIRVKPPFLRDLNPTHTHHCIVFGSIKELQSTICIFHLVWACQLMLDCKSISAHKILKHIRICTLCLFHWYCMSDNNIYCFTKQCIHN